MRKYLCSLVSVFCSCVWFSRKWVGLVCVSVKTVLEQPTEARTFSFMLHASLGLVGSCVLCCLYSRTQAAAMKHFLDKKLSNSVLICVSSIQKEYITLADFSLISQDPWLVKHWNILLPYLVGSSKGIWLSSSSYLTLYFPHGICTFFS